MSSKVDAFKSMACMHASMSSRPLTCKMIT
jgi:hypothetical protein